MIYGLHVNPGFDLCHINPAQPIIRSGEEELDDVDRDLSEVSIHCCLPGDAEDFVTSHHRCVPPTPIIFFWQFKGRHGTEWFGGRS